MYHALINHHLRRKPRPNAAAAAELLEEMKAAQPRASSAELDSSSFH